MAPERIRDTSNYFQKNFWGRIYPQKQAAQKVCNWAAAQKAGIAAQMLAVLVVASQVIAVQAVA